MSFVGLHTALSGIRAAQTGLDTASHNVSNANTPGFTRQRVDLRTSSPYWSPVGPVGTGVTVTGIGRVRDAFLDARARTVGGELAWHDTGAQLLARAESVLGEPDHGLTAPLGAVWDAFEDLALDPAGGASRRQVVAALDAFAARVRGVATGWDQLAADTTGRLDDAVRSTNDLLTRVAQLNRQIGDVSLRDGTPSDLLDQRDLALDELAETLGATITTAADGMVSVQLPAAGGGSVALVEGTTTRPLSVTAGALSADVDGTATAVSARGEVGALQRFLTVTLPQRHTDLDAFVTGLAGTLNTTHAGGFDADGQPGGDLFTLDPLTGAARRLAVTAGLLTDPGLLAAAVSDPPAAHDGRNAESLAGLRTAQVGGQPPFDSRLAAFVVDLGAQVATARNAADNTTSLSVAANVARQSMHGVSLDEEMVSVVAHQRALEAASRVMTAVDEALDVLINRTGIVGR